MTSSLLISLLFLFIIFKKKNRISFVIFKQLYSFFFRIRCAHGNNETQPKTQIYEKKEITIAIQTNYKKLSYKNTFNNGEKFKKTYYDQELTEETKAILRRFTQ
jgi:hypothetical protein